MPKAAAAAVDGAVVAEVSADGQSLTVTATGPTKCQIADVMDQAARLGYIRVLVRI